MIREKSAGVIVFKVHPRDGLGYLVLYHRGSYWNFPKGKMEKGENEIQTAKRELKAETSIDGIQIIKGWRQQTQFFFKEERNGKKELVKKDYILYLAKMPKDARVDITGEHDGWDNGYAWFDFKTALKQLKFKQMKEIMKEADSYVNKKIEEYRRNKNSKK